MFSLLLMGMLILTLSITLMLTNLLISKKMFQSREKSTPYECGFDTYYAASQPFTVQFLLVSIMFLMFDIEIVVLIPMIPAIFFKSVSWIVSSSIILIVLMMGLYVEWLESSIDWERC